MSPAHSRAHEGAEQAVEASSRVMRRGRGDGNELVGVSDAVTLVFTVEGTTSSAIPISPQAVGLP
jgi:hypothetical protein